MKKILILFIFIYINAAGQSEFQKKYEAKFERAFCECLEENKDLSPFEILFKASDKCILKIFSSTADEIYVLFNSRDWGKNDTLSEYKKGVMIGKEIAFNMIDDLVANCEFYQKTLNGYKLFVLENLKASFESLQSCLIDMKSKEETYLESDKHNLYTLIALLYEFTGEKEQALNYYEKSLQTRQNTSAKGLKTMLELKK